jgi:hypothetical protein
MTRRGDRRNRGKQKITAQHGQDQRRCSEYDGDSVAVTSPEAERNDIEAKPHQGCANKPDNNNSAHLANEAKMVRYTRAVMFLTGGLLFVGAVTVVVLIVHAIIFYRTDETSRAAQRAFVAVRQIVVDPLISPDQTPIYKFSFGWENSGSTETVDLVTGSRFAIAPNISLPKFENGRKRVLLPKGMFEEFAVQLGGSEINAIRDGKIRVFILGWATYADVFDLKHVTLACYQLTASDVDYLKPGGGGAGGIQCAEYNCADQSCRRYSNIPEAKLLLDYLDK